LVKDKAKRLLKF